MSLLFWGCGALDSPIKGEAREHENRRWLSRADESDEVIKYKSESYAATGNYRESIRQARKIGRSSPLFASAQAWIEKVENAQLRNQVDSRDGFIRVNDGASEVWPEI